MQNLFFKKKFFNGQFYVNDKREKNIVDQLSNIDKRYAFFLFSWHTQQYSFKDYSKTVKIDQIFPSKVSQWENQSCPSVFYYVKNRIDNMQMALVKKTLNYNKLIDETLELVDILLYIERLNMEEKSNFYSELKNHRKFFNQLKLDSHQKNIFFGTLTKKFKVLYPIANKQAMLVSGYARNSIKKVTLPRVITNLINGKIGLIDKDNLRLINQVIKLTIDLSKAGRYSFSILIENWLNPTTKYDRLQTAVETLKGKVNEKALLIHGGTSASIGRLLSCPIVRDMSSSSTTDKLSLSQIICDTGNYQHYYQKTSEFFKFQKEMYRHDIEIIPEYGEESSINIM